MIMFKDYWKFNKLLVMCSAALSLVFGLISIALIIFLNYLIVNEATSFGNRYFSFERSIYIGLTAIVIIIISLLVATVIRNSIGKVRRLILLHRGRSYYLKFQLVISIMIGLVTVILFQIQFFVTTLYDYCGAVKPTSLPMPYLYSSNLAIYKSIIYGLLVICLIYIIVYIIDLISNTELRYQHPSKSYFKVSLFISRVLLIAASFGYLVISFDNITLDYNNGYRYLITSPYLFSTSPILLAVLTAMIVVVVDYIIFFQKKVIV